MTKGNLLKHLQEIQDEEDSSFDLNYSTTNNIIIISFRPNKKDMKLT